MAETHIYIYIEDYCIGNCMSSHWSGKWGISKSIRSQGGGKCPIPSSTRFIEYGRKTLKCHANPIATANWQHPKSNSIGRYNGINGPHLRMMTIDFPILCKTDKLTFVFGFKLRQATLVFSPKKKKKKKTNKQKRKPPLSSFFDIFEQGIDNYQTINGEEERKSSHTLFELIRSQSKTSWNQTRIEINIFL